MNPNTRVSYLDGLRGLLALIVFAHHFLYAFYPEAIFGGNAQDFTSKRLTIERMLALTPLNVLINPGMAILFFFLLSGYVQTKVYFDSGNMAILQRSFIKRYFRLMVPTLTVVLLVFLFHRMGLVHKEWIPESSLSGGWAKSQMPDNLGFWGALNHGFLQCFISTSRYYQVLWTMPVELLNSLLVLTLPMIAHRLNYKGRLFFAWLLVQLFVLNSYNGAAFTLGLLFAYHQKNTPALTSFLRKGPVTLLCWAVGLYFASYPFTGYQASVPNSIYRYIDFFEKYPHTISYLIGVSLLFCALYGTRGAQKLLSSRPFLFFGDISFLFYLVHFLLLFSFSPWLFKTLQGHTGLRNNLLITGLATFGLITAVSYLLYRLVDKPTIKLCNTCTKKIFGV